MKKLREKTKQWLRPHKWWIRLIWAALVLGLTAWGIWSVNVWAHNVFTDWLLLDTSATAGRIGLVVAAGAQLWLCGGLSFVMVISAVVIAVELFNWVL